MKTIQELINLSGMSQSAFCRKYGIPYATVRHWLEGKRQPPAYVVSLLNRAVLEDLEENAKSIRDSNE